MQKMYSYLVSKELLCYSIRMLKLRTIAIVAIFLTAALFLGPEIAAQLEPSFPPLNLGVLSSYAFLLILLGAAMMLFSSVALFYSGSLLESPTHPSIVFCISGLYSRMRNPFLLGAILVLWGETLEFASIPLITYSLLLTFGIHFWVTFFEEPALQRAFGRVYLEYRKDVPRWFPRLGKSKTPRAPKHHRKARRKIASTSYNHQK